MCNFQQSIWLRLCRPRGKAGVCLWVFLWVVAGSGGPWRWSLGGVLMAFGKRKGRVSKTTRQEICANIKEHGSKEGPKSGPEITDSRAV